MGKLDYNLDNIVAFCILMENGEGIIGKSPDYIMEKFRKYCLPVPESDINAFETGLDSRNRLKFFKYQAKWFSATSSISKLVTVLLTKEDSDG